MEWRNIWRGLVIGTSDLIPGISGGTMAVILGIYQRLIEAINGLFSSKWKQSVMYLIPVGIGMGAAIFGFSRVMDWLLKNAAHPTYYFFIGLILGIVPYLLRTVDYKRTFKAFHYILLAVSFVFMILLSFLRVEEGGELLTSPTGSQFLQLFFAGWLASTALVLPGISGTFVLLLMGLYPSIIGALKDLNLPIIAVVGAGVMLGIVITSKLLSLLLNKYMVGTYAIINGMMVGAAIIVFPGIPDHIGTLLLSILCFVIGIAIALFLGKVEKNK